jgi:squalene-associated FAD-dependent desaturase
MSGNQAVKAYLSLIGARARLTGPKDARFEFIALPSLERWTIRPNLGPLPWWILSKARRAPQTRARDYLSLLGLLRPRAGLRVEEAAPCSGAVWTRLMQPFLLAALNTRPEEGSAALAAAVVRETLARGGRAYRPRIAEPTLAAAFVDPALAYISARGGVVRTGRRLRSADFKGEVLASLAFADGDTTDCADAGVILAVPPWTAQDLVPSLTAPDAFRSIVNGHFKIAPPASAPPMIGVVGGLVEWIFAFEDRIGVTVSNADALIDLDRETLAQRLWAEVAAVYDMPSDLPPWQIIKEKRATFAATVEQDHRRPPSATAWRNLALAGDWTQTGLPGTIEGAIRSGFKAADLVMRGLSKPAAGSPGNR